MSMKYIQDHYGVPAEIGRRVAYKGQEGTIVDNHNQYIVVHFDGEKKPRGVFHPTDGITYLGMGTPPKMTRSQERYRRYLSVADCFDNFRQFLLYEKTEKDARRCGFSDVYSYNQWLRSI